jgi:hypothetical protein
MPERNRAHRPCEKRQAKVMNEARVCAASDSAGKNSGPITSAAAVA